MFKWSAREDVDTRVARLFHSCEISLNIARSPFWIDAVKAINDAPRGYKPPSLEKIRTVLLDKEKTTIDNRLVTIKRDWAQYGVSIVSDGWSNLKNQPLINVLSVSGGKPIFLTALDSSGEEKNATYIVDFFAKSNRNCGKFSTLEVIQVKKTRFGHHYVVMERLQRVKNSLINMVLNDEWETIKNGTTKSKLAHDEVKSIILHEQFCKDIKFILSFTKLIWKMIRFCDSDKAIIGEVYQRMKDMLGSINEALSMHSEMYREIELLVMTSLGPGNKNRCKPHADSFVQSVYLDAIRKLVSAQDAPIVRKQLSDFTCDGGVFAKPEAIEDRKTMSSMEWWNLYGAAAPQLYYLVTKVLSQSVNSSCAERVWSSYGFIHSVRRNKLNVDRAESLVYVHYNNCILTRFEQNYEKSYKNWDRNTYEDFLEDDLEAIKDQELTILNRDD